jgi:hypothetical protein
VIGERRFVKMRFFEIVKDDFDVMAGKRGIEKRNTLSVRNAHLRTEFEKAYKAGFRNEVITKRLAEQFFLSVATVEAIVFNKGVYKEF